MQRRPVQEVSGHPRDPSEEGVSECPQVSTDQSEAHEPHIDQSEAVLYSMSPRSKCHSIPRKACRPVTSQHCEYVPAEVSLYLVSQDHERCLGLC